MTQQQSKLADVVEALGGCILALVLLFVWLYIA